MAGDIPIVGATVVGVQPGYSLNLWLTNGGGVAIEDPLDLVSGELAVRDDYILVGAAHFR